MSRVLIQLCAAVLCAASLVAADTGPVLLLQASGTPVASMKIAPGQVDAVTLPTPREVNGASVADAVASGLAKRRISVQRFDLTKSQPTTAQLEGAAAVVIVAPVYYGGTHWAVKKLIDDRIGAIYYAQARGMKRAAVILLAESGSKVGGAMGDFNSSGAQFPNGANRVDRIFETSAPATIPAAVSEMVGQIATLAGAKP